MKLELLAPAKNLEQGILAVNCGADAVYIGADRFGARTAVGNTVQDIEKLVAHAHRYWAKVFVAFNTILYDNELEEAGKLIWQLHAAGVDALIIQDMGILEMNLPKIPLHASTQTFITEPEKAVFLEKQGFERLILARELSLDQIREIRKKTTVELEAFVHGALCVCFSGQCYFSQAVCRRSGNRGECCQACRYKYDLEDSSGRCLLHNKHLLSLHDYNLSDYLPQLIEAGISSFKIEGRLKDADYIKNVVPFYRKKLDAALAKYPSLHTRASSGIVETSFQPKPEETFNRGFTHYFIEGKRHPIANFSAATFIGNKIGKVKSLGRDCFVFDGNVALANGDGISFFDKSGKLHGSNVNNVLDDKVYLQSMEGLVNGAEIYRNFNRLFLKELDQGTVERLIDVDFELFECNGRICVKGCDEDCISAEVELDVPVTFANDDRKGMEMIRKQLSRTGGSIFRCRNVFLPESGVYFIPASVLNQVRRDILSALEKKRMQQLSPSGVVTVRDENYPYSLGENLNYQANVSNRLAKQFYLKHGVKTIEPAFELQNHVTGKVIMTTRHCIKYECGLCPRHKNPNPANLLKNDFTEPLYLVNSGSRFRLRFDCAKCQMEIMAP